MSWSSSGPGRWAEAGGDREIPSFKDSLFSLSVGVSFLDGFVADVGQGTVPTVSAVPVRSAWADCGVVEETVEDLAAQGLCESWSTKEGANKVGKEVSWVLLPAT